MCPATMLNFVSKLISTESISLRKIDAEEWIIEYYGVYEFLFRFLGNC